MKRARFRPVDVANDFGRSAHWLRLLERQGKIPPAQRDFANRRFYTVADVAKIREIICGKLAAVWWHASATDATSTISSASDGGAKGPGGAS